jgi:hypothetical protein
MEQGLRLTRTGAVPFLIALCGTFLGCTQNSDSLREERPIVSDGYEWSYFVLMLNSGLNLFIFPTKKLATNSPDPDKISAARAAEIFRKDEYAECRLENEQEIVGEQPKGKTGWNFWIICPPAK